MKLHKKIAGALLTLAAALVIGTGSFAADTTPAPAAPAPAPPRR